MEEKKKNNKIILAVIGIIMILGIIGGVTYAYFSAQASTETQTITTAKLDIGFTNGDIIRAIDIEPIDDVDIKTKATELPFTITNNGNKDMKADIKLTNIEIDEELKNVNFRWGLFNEDTGLAVSRGTFTYIEESPYIIRDAVIDAKEAKNYILRVWIHNNGLLQNEMQEKVFSAKVDVTAQILEYTDESCFITYGMGDIQGYDDNCPKDVVIPKSLDGKTVTKIGPFFQNKGLTSVIIPDTVTNLSGTFSGNNLTYITIPESITSLDSSPFVNNNISNIYMHDNISSLEHHFSNNNLKSIVLPENITYFGCGAISDNPLTELILNTKLNGISEYMICSNSSPFANNKIKEIEIPNNINVIGATAFINSPDLQKIIVRGKNGIEDFKTDFSQDSCDSGSYPNPSVCTKAPGLTSLNDVEIIFVP